MAGISVEYGPGVSVGFLELEHRNEVNFLHSNDRTNCVTAFALTSTERGRRCVSKIAWSGKPYFRPPDAERHESLEWKKPPMQNRYFDWRPTQCSLNINFIIRSEIYLVTNTGAIY